MYVIYLVLESLLLTIITFFVSRSPKFCEHYNELPKKFIIDSKFSNIMFLKPKYPITKWFFILTLVQLSFTFIVILLSILCWIGLDFLIFLNTHITLIIYLVLYGLCFIPVGITNSIIVEKYIFKK